MMKNNFFRRPWLWFPLVLLLTATVALGSLYEPSPGPNAPRVLLSIDATWWNWLKLNRFTYMRALRRAGLEPILIDNLKQLDERALTELMNGVTGVVLSGGGDVDPLLYGGDPETGLEVKPDRDSLELALLELADQRALPLLGICRGAQLLNVQRGGTLLSFRDKPVLRDRHKRVAGGHSVRVVAGSQLAGIYAATEIDDVTTWHGQAVDRPGAGVEIVAWSEDGIAEAIEIPGGPFRVGVQWHAETEFFEGPQQRLFDAFAAAVQARRESAAGP